MNSFEFRYLMDLLMVSEPWPLSDISHNCLINMVDSEAKERGYSDWITAYHEFKF